MAPKPVDILFRQHVDPTMRALGFRRKKWQYQKASPDGRDLALVEIVVRGMATPPWRPFAVTTGISLGSSREYFGLFVHGDDKPAEPRITLGLEAMRGIPPRYRHDGIFNDDLTINPVWRFSEDDADDIAACGAELSHLLVEKLIPDLDELIIRKKLLEIILADRGTTRARVRSQYPWTMDALYAAIDDEPEGLVRELLEQHVAAGGNRNSIRWVHFRLDQRSRSLSLNRPSGEDDGSPGPD